MKHQVQQLTEEWYKLRRLKLTASHAQAIAANGAGLRTYVTELLQNYYCKVKQEGFSNHHTERGNDLESSARFLYEIETGNEVKLAGFETYSKHPNHVGCSPDGYVGDDGLVEIKNPSDKVYFKYLESDKVDSGYLLQMQMQMLVCDRQWVDYVVYNPNFDKEIIIKRIYPDKGKFDKLEKGFESGIKMIKEMMEKIDKKVGRS